MAARRAPKPPLLAVYERSKAVARVLAWTQAVTDNTDTFVPLRRGPPRAGADPHVRVVSEVRAVRRGHTGDLGSGRARGDAYLHAAVQLGLALAAREVGTADPADSEAMADIEDRIGHELARLDTMDGHCDRIGRHVDKLMVMSDHARGVLRALDARRAGLRGPAARTATVQLAADSLDLARLTLATPAAGAAR